MPQKTKEERAEYLRRWKDDNWDRYRDRQRRANIKSKYGITLEELDTLHAAQDGQCAVCGVEAPCKGTHGLHIDHDHDTGEIRGLLCGQCNRALGLLAEDPARIRNLADYLEN